MATFTVGTSGRNYSTLQAAWNALPATLAENYIFDCYNDGMLAGLDTTLSVKSMAGFTVTIQAAAGQSFRDHASKLTNALRFNQSNGVAFQADVFNAPAWAISVPGVILKNIQLRNSNNNGSAITVSGSGNYATATGCIFDASSSVTVQQVVINNCVVLNRGATGGGLHFNVSAGHVMRNNTVAYVGSSTTSSGNGFRFEYFANEASNNVVMRFTTGFLASSTTFAAGSDYNATTAATIGTGVGTHNIVNLVAADAITAIGTAGSEDLKVKAGSALINAGTYYAATDPDILGRNRNATTPTIGAYEYITATGPTINTHPTPQTVTEPATATFTGAATASAGVVAYQWEVNPGSGYVNVSTGTGGTIASYTTAATSASQTGYFFRFRATDSNGFTYSDPAQLTVNAVVVVKGVNETFGVPAGAATGVTAMWWDASPPVGNPVLTTATESWDASGVFVWALTGTSLPVGGTGHLMIFKSGATAPDDLAFSGRIVVKDIT